MKRLLWYIVAGLLFALAWVWWHLYGALKAFWGE